MTVGSTGAPPHPLLYQDAFFCWREHEFPARDRSWPRPIVNDTPVRDTAFALSVLGILYVLVILAVALVLS